MISHSFESMTCKDVVIDEPPIASIYDVKKENNSYKNELFDTERESYKRSLKKYFSNLKKYCNI